jgi:hypothetical protein
MTENSKGRGWNKGRHPLSMGKKMVDTDGATIISKS